jgi:hypothetical protein
MATLTPHDPIAWARKPRSQKALDFVIELANDKEHEFVDILSNLKQNGITDGTRLLKRWDYATHTWMKHS